METVKGGIKDEKQLRNVHGRLIELRGKIAKARGEAKGRDATRTLDQLSKAVDGHLAQLDKPMAGPRITSLVETFNSAMKELNEGGRLSPSKANEKRALMGVIRELAQAERSKAKSKEAKETLDELIRAATQVIRALGG